MVPQIRAYRWQPFKQFTNPHIMKTLKKIKHEPIITLLVFFLTTGNILAQQEKGDVQMQFSATFTSIKTSSGSSSNFQYQYATSKFITRHTELGFSYIGNSSEDFNYQYLAPFFNFNILSKSGRFVFYVGSQYLLSFSKSGDASVTSGGVGIKAGIRSYVSSNVFYFVGPNFTFQANNQSQFDLTAGIGVLLKKAKKTE
jgi:hypothetical protein